LADEIYENAVSQHVEDYRQIAVGALSDILAKSALTEEERGALPKREKRKRSVGTPAKAKNKVRSMFALAASDDETSDSAGEDMRRKQQKSSAMPSGSTTGKKGERLRVLLLAAGTWAAGAWAVLALSRSLVMAMMNVMANLSEVLPGRMCANWRVNIGMHFERVTNIQFSLEADILLRVVCWLDGSGMLQASACLRKIAVANLQSRRRCSKLWT
jgi:hypothetical protein